MPYCLQQLHRQPKKPFKRFFVHDYPPLASISIFTRFSLQRESSIIDHRGIIRNWLHSVTLGVAAKADFAAESVTWSPFNYGFNRFGPLDPPALGGTTA